MGVELLLAIGCVLVVWAQICIYKMGYHTGRAEVYKQWMDWIDEIRSLRGNVK